MEDGRLGRLEDGREETPVRIGRVSRYYCELQSSRKVSGGV
jgi:hypothetical protein